MQLLGSELRREILRLIWTHERAAGEIARCFKVTFGAVSQHLARLRAAGVVRQRRDGKRLYYMAERQALGPLAAALEAMWADKLGALKKLAEAEQTRIGIAATASSRHLTEP